MLTRRYKHAARSKPIFPVIVLLLVVVATVCIVAYIHNPCNKRLKELTAERDLLESFLTTHMMTSQGGVRTTYLDAPYSDSHAAGSDVLSESQGLLMEHALLRGDRELFERVFSFTRENMINDGILSYRYSSEREAHLVNAAIDDLRMIRVLSDASDVFGDAGYLEYARQLGDSLLASNASDGKLVDFYEAEHGRSADFLTLCYSDISAMDRIRNLNPHWEIVMKQSLTIVLEGYLGDASPLFASRYDYKTGMYSVDDIETVQTLITAIHLAQANTCPPAVIEHIKGLAERGELYGRFDSQGRALVAVESTAIYALAVQLGATVGDKALMDASLEQMRRFQIRDSSHILYGGFADPQSMSAYSFDNLSALLAYDVYLSQLMLPENDSH